MESDVVEHVSVFFVIAIETGNSTVAFLIALVMTDSSSHVIQQVLL